MVFDPADATVIGEEGEVDEVDGAKDRTLFDPDRDKDGQISRKGTGVGRKVPEAPLQRQGAVAEMPSGGHSGVRPKAHLGRLPVIPRSAGVYVSRPHAGMAEDREPGFRAAVIFRCSPMPNLIG